MWKRITWSSAAAALLAVVLISTALGAGGPPPGRGPGGGETETPGNNLSVPAIFVSEDGMATGAPALRVPCDQAPKAPGADGALKSTQFPDYWLQKTDATWSASCSSQASIGGVVADWGDNLTSAGSLAAGKPVRVEVGLLDPAATGLTGYTVTKLTPELEDRLATYGTDGTSFTTGDPGAPVTRVWDSGAKLKIEQLDANGAVIGTVLPEQPMTAEINSSGAVVYGYNWGSRGQSSTPVEGTYRLTFTTSTATTITDIADKAGTFVPTFDEHSTTLVVTLGGTPEGGGGGGGETGPGNNLSVPAVFVPSSTAAGAPALRVPCENAPQAPGFDGALPSADPAFLGYWLQNTEATWSAACKDQASIGGVVADWSDSLTAPEESLTGGRPLRIELGLLAPDVTMQGYQVDNLTPDAEDRLATYGTKGVEFTSGVGGSPPTDVWDSGGRLTIIPVVDGVLGSAVYDGPMAASVSSSGAVVYGFTWGGEGGKVTAPPAGTYALVFSTSDATTIGSVADSAESGAVNIPTSTAHSTTLVVTLTGTTGSGEGQGGPPPGKGSGGGETETLGNNLSVPAIFVPSLVGAPALRVPCPAAPQAPGADGVLKSTDFPGYWLQKSEATWSASCSSQTSIGGVVADWGDNLTTAGSLAAGKPVRVEVGLLDPAATGLTGYTITNLTPLLEDRLATYGTDGTSFTTGATGAPETHVWDSGAKLKIEQLDTSGAVSKVVLPEQAMTAEINSSGAVVYGYNWGSKGQSSTPTQGTYRLTFTTSTATTLAGVADTAEAGALNVPTFDEHSTTLVVTLGASGGGGGGGGGGGHGGGGGR